MKGECRKAWITDKLLKSGKRSYRLRWIAAGRWQGKTIGTDRKLAEREAALLQGQLEDGTWTNIRNITWNAFVAEHVAKIRGKAHATEARHALVEFGRILNPPNPRSVRYRDIESFVAACKTDGLAIATINKRLRYLRGAFNSAIKREYAAKNPLSDWTWEREDRRAPRIVTDNEESAILTAAEELYGLRWQAFLFVALRTGARSGELFSLPWSHVDLGDARIHLAGTKGKRDRYVPITDETTAALRRLQAQTLKAGGPFIGLNQNVSRTWKRILKAAGADDTIQIHDLRRTCTVRLLKAGVPITVVKKLLGHASIATTERYYTWVNQQDLRYAIENVGNAVSSG